ncbi:uncharacterized protein LOC101848765 [Aplysia californica]|uniref:Uncharacterized protein LOC101848765 n=1 Tax=Aplysia californica TaxID=6500 RepID=A0ABM1A515_APLCA|nr:uncharacterized protein LOC101848765 [Aplysia californica]
MSDERPGRKWRRVSSRLLVVTIWALTVSSTTAQSDLGPTAPSDPSLSPTDATLPPYNTSLFPYGRPSLDLICPNGVQGEKYLLTVELYNIPITTVQLLSATLYAGQTILAQCKPLCSIARDDLRGVLSFIYGTLTTAAQTNSAFQTRVTIPSSVIEDGSLRVKWKVDGGNSVINGDSSCDVKFVSSLDDCSDNPCLNGGSCQQDSNGFSCSCLPGFFGTRCTAGDYQFQCQANQIDVTFQNPNNPNGDCTTKVLPCFVARGSSQPAEIQNYTQVFSDETSSLSVSVSVSGSDMVFQICVAQSTQEGNYSNIYDVHPYKSGSENLADFRVTLVVRVKFGGTFPPRFNAAFYQVNLSENTSKGRTLVHVNVSSTQTCDQDCIQIVDPDPDDSRVGYLSIRVDVSGSQSEIAFRNETVPGVSLGYFYVAERLTPALHYFVVTAVDGEFLSSTATVVFNVTDEPDPVECTRARIDTEIPPDVAGQITSLSCKDPDRPNNTSALSFSLSGELAAFFSISDSGVISVDRPLNSVLRLKSPTIITLRAKVEKRTDDGSLPLYVPITFIVFGLQEPFNCTFSTTTPDGPWGPGTNFSISVTCNSNLQTQQIRVFPSARIDQVFPKRDFRQINSSRVDVVFSMELFMAFIYQVAIQVSSPRAGLNITKSISIPVFNAPVFQNSSSVISVSERAALGSIVHEIKASSENLTSVLEFSVIEADDAYYSAFILEKYGTLFVRKDDSVNLSLFIGVRIQMKVQVRDQTTNLTATKNFLINIVDETDPPSCTWQSRYGDITWRETLLINVSSYVPIGSVLGQLNCVQSDAKQALSFSYTTASPVELHVSNSGQVILKTFIRFDNISVLLLVSDGVNQVTFNLNILVIASPPQPLLSVDTIGDEWVIANYSLDFDYDWIDLAQTSGVLKSLKLQCKVSKNALQQDDMLNWDAESDVGLRSSRAVVELLSPGQNYTCKLMASGLYGMTVSEAVNITTLEKPSVIISSNRGSTVLDTDTVQLTCVLDNRRWDQLGYIWNGGGRSAVGRKRTLDLLFRAVNSSVVYTYECLVSYSQYSDITSAVYRFTVRSAKSNTYFYKAGFVLKMESLSWYPDLALDSSPIFSVLKSSLVLRINALMQTRSQFYSCVVGDFKSGSVVANLTLSEIVDQRGQTTDVVQYLQEQVSAGALARAGTFCCADTLEGLKTHVQTTPPYNGSVPQGSRVTLLCHFVAYTSGDVTEEVEWLWEGKTMDTANIPKLEARTEKLHLQGYTFDPTVFAYYYKLSLVIDDFQQRQTGGYACGLHLRSGRLNLEKNLTVSVERRNYVPEATARLRPYSPFLEIGRSLVMNCTATYAQYLELVDDTGKILGDTYVQTQPSVAIFYLQEVVRNMTVVCKARNNLELEVESNAVQVTVFTNGSKRDMCRATTERGVFWNVTFVGHSLVTHCARGFLGLASRFCNPNKTWGPIDFSNCQLVALETIRELVDSLSEGTESETLEDIVTRLWDISEYEYFPKHAGEVVQTVDILSDLGETLKYRKDLVLKTEYLKKLADVTDKLLSADEVDWPSTMEPDSDEEQAISQAALQYGEGKHVTSAKLLVAMDDLSDVSMRRNDLTNGVIITKNNFVIRQNVAFEDIIFPDEGENVTYEDWVRNSGTGVFLSKEAFAQTKKQVKFTVIAYKDLTEQFRNNTYLKERYEANGKAELIEDTAINSNVVTFSLDADLETLSPPLELRFSLLNIANEEEPNCAFLDPSESGPVGLWSSEGCVRSMQKDGFVVCQCDHLTNFAILMSPYGESPSGHHEILSIISYVGCGLSILCLLITLIVHATLWRYVKSDRTILHVHLSICLILAYVAFLAGVDRTENEIACTVVAAVLHFLFLAVFFIMLAEGIEILVFVKVVFEKGSLLWRLLLVAYGIPVVIVGVSLGVTKTDGYGNENFCWLSVDDGLLWAFVGPALAVLLTNFIIAGLVVHTLLNTATMLTKGVKMRTRSVVKALCILSPLLGLTWVFGAMSVNEDLVVFQYIFGILNSLQGLLIFLFHCVFCHQIRDGYNAVKRKYRARSFDSGQKLASSSNKFYSDSESGSGLGSKANLKKDTAAAVHNSDYSLCNPALESDGSTGRSAATTSEYGSSAASERPQNAASVVVPSGEYDTLDNLDRLRRVYDNVGAVNPRNYQAMSTRLSTGSSNGSLGPSAGSSTEIAYPRGRLTSNEMGEEMHSTNW